MSCRNRPSFVLIHIIQKTWNAKGALRASKDPNREGVVASHGPLVSNLSDKPGHFMYRDWIPEHYIRWSWIFMVRVCCEMRISPSRSRHLAAMSTFSNGKL